MNTTPYTYYGHQPTGEWVFADAMINSKSEIEGPFSGPPPIPGITPVYLAVPWDSPNASNCLYALHGILFRMLGDETARNLIGLTMAYVAAPALLAVGYGHPGLWIFGKAGTGKTTISYWLSCIFGISPAHHVVDAPPLTNRSTPMGIQKLLMQRSCLPVRLDDYRCGTVCEPVEAILRSAYDRSAIIVGMSDDLKNVRTQQTLTTPMISGETTSCDAATRDRYLPVDLDQVRKEISKREISDTTNILCRQLPRIGTALMRQDSMFTNFLFREINPQISEGKIVHRYEYNRVLAQAAFRAGLAALNVHDEFN